MYSVQLVKLTGANFESTVYKPGFVVQFKCIEVLNVGKNYNAFRILFSAIKKKKLLKTIGYFEMTVICGNSGQWLLLFKVRVSADREGKDSWVAFSSCTNCKLAAIIWLFTGFNWFLTVSFICWTSCRASERPALSSWLCSLLCEIISLPEVI